MMISCKDFLNTAELKKNPKNKNQLAKESPQQNKCHIKEKKATCH